MRRPITPPMQNAEGVDKSNLPFEDRCSSHNNCYTVRISVYDLNCRNINTAAKVHVQIINYYSSSFIKYRERYGQTSIKSNRVERVE